MISDIRTGAAVGKILLYRQHYTDLASVTSLTAQQILCTIMPMMHYRRVCVVHRFWLGCVKVINIIKRINSGTVVIEA